MRILCFQGRSLLYYKISPIVKIEKMLIACVHPVVRIYRLKGFYRQKTNRNRIEQALIYLKNPSADMCSIRNKIEPKHTPTYVLTCLNCTWTQNFDVIVSTGIPWSLNWDTNNLEQIQKRAIKIAIAIGRGTRPDRNLQFLWNLWGRKVC